MSERLDPTYHEAAHCVAAWRFGLARLIKNVDIDRKPPGVEWKEPPERVHRKSAMIILLAGDVADWWHSCSHGRDFEETIKRECIERYDLGHEREGADWQPPGSPNNDMALLRSLLAKDPAMASTAVDAIVGECRRLVAERWTKIALLADELRAARRMEGNRVREILGPRDVSPG